jgi:hypothetical protein
MCGSFNPIFYCFLPIFIASEFPELNVIYSAIFENKEIISATCCIGFLVIYTQSIIAFNFLDIVYFDVNIGDGERVCPNML